MAKKGFRFPTRHMVSPDGVIYFVRALHSMGTCEGVYIPRPFREALRWDKDRALQIWVKGDTLCIRALPDKLQDHGVDTTPPKTWREFDRERQLSVFQGGE